ncbi:MAG TPA: rubredoxin [Deltaproteobacteria bacterium]|nr:rubredoxin [Deltaproteobacteria bacterium]HCY10783.1 rubredoxin [Deltaproteobacteria bacterium]
MSNWKCTDCGWSKEARCKPEKCAECGSAAVAKVEGCGSGCGCH